MLALAALLGHWRVLSGIGSGERAADTTSRDAALEVRTISAEALADAMAEPEVVAPPDVPVVVAPPPKRRTAAPREATSARATPPERAASAAAYEAALAAADSASASAASEPAASAADAVDHSNAVATAASAPIDDVASPVASSPVASAASATAFAALAAASSASGLDVSATSNPASSVAVVGPSSAGDLVVRTYRTKMPPPMTMTYEVRRGFLRVKGEARWRPVEGAYRVELEAKLGGITALSQTSEGGFDAAGLAPVRFVDKRLNRTNAANFQREANKITFSGNPAELPIPAGAQDRLSYLFQLAAVLSAEPELAAPGGTVAMFVVGARADAAVWVLRFVASEFVDTVDGAVRAAHFTRDARGPYDSTIDVWVDPARYYLPVRAKQRSGTDEIDLLLETMTPFEGRP